jgi:hypothetical protein
MYGGTERVVSYLTEGLVRLGHEVTLFASGDSKTTAKLIAACPRALWQEEQYREWLPYDLRMMELVFNDLSRFDVLHFHTDYIQFPFLRRQPFPNITTMHGRLHAPDLRPMFDEYAEMPLVSISDDQRRPVSQTGKQPSIMACRGTSTPCVSVLVSTWHSLVAFRQKSGWTALLRSRRRRA